MTILPLLFLWSKTAIRFPWRLPSSYLKLFLLFIRCSCQQDARLTENKQLVSGEETYLWEMASPGHKLGLPELVSSFQVLFFSSPKQEKLQINWCTACFHEWKVFAHQHQCAHFICCRFLACLQCQTADKAVCVWLWPPVLESSFWRSLQGEACWISQTKGCFMIC